MGRILQGNGGMTPTMSFDGWRLLVHGGEVARGMDGAR
jgi:hypothetical protein